MTLDIATFGKFAVKFNAGDIIFSEFEPGNSFFFIHSGQVRIVKVIDDTEKNIDILNPGEIFGEMAILEEAPRSASAIAVGEDVTLLEFNRQNFDILMSGNTQMALMLLKLFTKRIYDQKRRFMILTLDDDVAKVADVFLMMDETQLSESADPADNDAMRKIFRVKVEDISNWAGLSIPRCRNILNQFQTQRKIEIYSDKILVENLNDFIRFVKSKRKVGDGSKKN